MAFTGNIFGRYAGMGTGQLGHGLGYNRRPFTPFAGMPRFQNQSRTIQPQVQSLGDAPAPSYTPPPAILGQQPQPQASGGVQLGGSQAGVGDRVQTNGAVGSVTDTPFSQINPGAGDANAGWSVYMRNNTNNRFDTPTNMNPGLTQTLQNAGQQLDLYNSNPNAYAAQFANPYGDGFGSGGLPTPGGIYDQRSAPRLGNSMPDPTAKYTYNAFGQALPQNVPAAAWMPMTNNPTWTPPPAQTQLGYIPGAGWSS